MDKKANPVKATKANKEKKDRKGAYRILYLTAALAICCVAVIGGILLARGTDEGEPLDLPVDMTPDEGGETPVDTSKILPEFAAPAVGSVTKKHDLEVLVYHSTTDDWRVHCGIDISAKMGDAVMAAADGVVCEVTEDPMMGMTVKIRHSGDAVTVYSNLSSELAEGITPGAEVKCGDVIGCIGETAITEIAEEPHLHFEMTVGGKAVDPMKYISDASAFARLGEDVSYEG